MSSTNSPETQIQAIGRNRGLDPTVEPAYIHATGRQQKTTFDLAHLKRADYYPELFKAQKKYNTDYVKILGDKVGKQIIDWVYAHLDEDETINSDRLKRQVLKFIAHALREINNKNSHQIKLSRAQLTNIVNYAMKGLDNEMANIKKPYRLSLTIRGLSYFLNFVSEIYYTVKRIPAALRMYYHSWFGERDKTKLSMSEKHADDVYVKIIQRTSFKDIAANMAPVLEFRSWIGQKFKGLETTLAKSRGDALIASTQQQLLQHKQQLIDPLLLHCVVASKQKQVADALKAFPQGLNYIAYRLPMLQGLFQHGGIETKLFQKHLLSFLHEIPGLGDLELADIVSFPDKIKAVQDLLTQPPIKILSQSQALQESATVRLAFYLQHDFVTKLSAFVSYPNVLIVQKVLTKDNNASLFIEHCLKKLGEGAEFSAPFLFQELKDFFKLDALKTLDQEMASTTASLEKIQQEISTHLINCIDEAHLNKIAKLISEQLIPLLVNLYPLEARERLYTQAADPDKIKKLLREQGNEVVRLMTEDTAKLAQLMFTHTTVGEVPAQLDITAEIQNATHYISEQMHSISTQSITTLIAGKLKTPSSWSLSVHLHDKAIADLLQSDEFLNAVSLMLPFNQWNKLRSQAKSNYPTLLLIARDLLDKMASTKDPVFNSPQDLLTLFNKHFKTTYHDSEQAKNQVEAELTDIVNAIIAKPEDHLSGAMKEQIATIGMKQVVPLLASFIKEDKKKQHFLQSVSNKDVVRDFIVRNRELLAAIGSKSEDELIPHAVTLINQLIPSAEALVTTDLHNPVTHAEQVGAEVARTMQQKFAIAFLNSTELHETLKYSFNQQDYQPWRLF